VVVLTLGHGVLVYQKTYILSILYNIQVIKLQAYKPNKTAMYAYIVMQTIAKNANKTVSEMALELGFSCGYMWLKSMVG
jgi:hypothetical protein